MNSVRLRYFDLLLLILLSGVFFLWRLDSPSVWRGDEAVYVLGVQDTLKTGDLWYPTWIPDGTQVPFWLKPPLRLWLGMLSIATFGESNFSHRLPDALAGFGVLLLTFLFALRISKSRLASYLAIGCLLSSSSFLFLHGPRHVSLDTLLLFLQLLAVWAGFRILELARTTSGPIPLRWSVLGGFASGLAIMTKSIAGLIPFGIIAIAVLVGGRLREDLHRSWKSALLALSIALGLGLPYFIFHCSFTFGACFPLVYEDIFLRSTAGFANQESWDLYLRAFLADRSLTPPELSILGSVFGLFVGFRKGVFSHRFLAVWALTPSIVFTLMPSRLLWYIYLALPAFSILVGLLGSELLERIEKSSGVKRTALSSGFLLTLAFIFAPMGSNVWRIAQSQKRLDLDTFVHGVLTQDPIPTVLGFKVNLHHPRSEAVYRGMLRDNFSVATTEAGLKSAVMRERPRFVVTHTTRLHHVVKQAPVQAYQFLPPVDGRFRWLTIVDLGPGPILSGFTSTHQQIGLDSVGPSELLYGWGPVQTVDGVLARSVTGDEAALLVAGDQYLQLTGVDLELALQAPTDRTALKLSLNGVAIDNITLKTPGFSIYQTEIPPGALRSGRNVLKFSLPELHATDRASSERNELLISFLRLRSKSSSPHYEATSRNGAPDAGLVTPLSD